MSVFTVTIRNLVESNYKIFGDYPIFDEAYRPVLEKKIIDRYYFREIGLETPAQFKQFLNTRMNEIMPFYNQHYQANEDFKVHNVYHNKDVTTEDTRVTKGDNSSNSSGSNSSTSSGTSKNVFNDTPSSKLGNEDYATNITDDTTNGNSSSQGNSSSTSKGTTTDEYVTRTYGHDGMKYPTEILKDLRKSFNNIDVLIINELKDLFMNIY